jgi:hypothetical protein
VANTAAAMSITRRRPMMSDSMPAGRLTTMPTIVDAAAMYPTVESGTCRERINSGSAGLLAIVELKMANPPMIHRRRNGDGLIFIGVTSYHCSKYYGGNRTPMVITGRRRCIASLISTKAWKSPDGLWDNMADFGRTKEVKL